MTGSLLIHGGRAVEYLSLETLAKRQNLKPNQILIVSYNTACVKHVVKP